MSYSTFALFFSILKGGERGETAKKNGSELLP